MDVEAHPMKADPFDSFGDRQGLSRSDGSPLSASEVRHRASLEEGRDVGAQLRNFVPVAARKLMKDDRQVIVITS
jgi:hypothetical protein